MVCGSPQIGDQVLCNFLNHLLGAYGTTLDVGQPSLQKQGDDRQLQELFQELRHDRIGAVILIDCNPVYDLPDGPEWANLLRRVPLTVACCERLDETTEAVQYVCPPPNYLASWGDAEPVRGLFSLTQPALRPLGNTRPVLECLAAWLGTQQSAYAQIRGHWETHLFPHQNEYATFQEFWDHAVHDGFVEIETERPPDLAFALGTVRPVLRATRLEGGNFALVLYPKVGLLDGRHAYNPWLQELPDPVTKATWDNYACLSPATAARLGLTEGDVVRLEASGGGSPLELPVLIQPGQHDQVVAIALGYGSKASERFAGVGPQWLEARPTLGPNGRVGVNAAPLKKWQDGTLAWVRNQATITRTQRRQPIASTQTHHTLNVPAGMAPAGQERRPIIQETTVRALAGPPQPPAPLAPPGRGVGGEGANAGPRPAEPDLWPNDHPITGPRWGMVIDLNACTGCSACVLACQVENNIPVVGKDEVQRQREMHWLRIDRYFATPPSQGGDGGGDVDVAFQPMLCQHCGNAPCETVCPVLATVHSSEGLNQQVYNRCVGTRYCANNCPYKVRRFNWFDYPHDDSLHNLVLNPDVTVRSRGVMEKCTFCVQRIQEAKYEARRRGLPLAEDMIQTACQQSCPARAIVFGDLNDPASKVSGQMRDPRRYQVLTELNVRPSVSYLKVVRNRTADQGGDGRG